MFGWITGGRIRELEGKLEDKAHDYARLMRNCDEHIHEINFKDHEINTLYGQLATNYKRLVEQDEVISQLKDANHSRPSRDPVTGRYMKRTDTRSLPTPLGWMSDGLRASISIRSAQPVTNANVDNAAS